MSPNPLLFAGLAIIATVSPLLTFLHLWQIKEWRVDRLLEHLKSEGWFRQLFGYSRPLIAVGWLVPIGVVFLQIHILLLFAADALPAFVDRFMNGEIYNPDTTDALMRLEEMLLLLYVGSLAACGLLQCLVRKQARPVWTKKALLIFILSLSLTSLLILKLMNVEQTMFELRPGIMAVLVVPFLLPLIAGLAFVILMPIDRFLKLRIIRKARQLRLSHPQLTVIGITGSVGKTTTKELLKHLLKDTGAMATPEHVNTEMGVASWLIRTLEHEPVDSTRTLIVEMGAYRLGEIALLCSIAQPTIGVLTFVGKQHVGLFGSEENIAAAKSELLASLPAEGHAFVNVDSPLIDKMLPRARCKTTRIGTGSRSIVRPIDIEETGKGIRFCVLENIVEVPLAGTHSVTNIVLAIAVAQHVGVPMNVIVRSISHFSAFERTFALHESGGITILDNSYNASVENFSASFDWAERQPHATKVLLCDGIIELGDSEERLHRELAERAAKIFSRALVVHKRFLPYFKPSFGDRVSLAMTAKEPLSAGSLLVCVGRMPHSFIRRLLPLQPQQP